MEDIRLRERLLALKEKSLRLWRHRALYFATLKQRFHRTPLEATNTLGEATPEAIPHPLRFLGDATERARLARAAWLPALFLVGIALGYSAKSWAEMTITIGHEDYRLPPRETLYEMNTLREQALERGAPLTVETRPEYPACSEQDILSDVEAAL